MGRGREGSRCRRREGRGNGLPPGEACGVLPSPPALLVRAACVSSGRGGLLTAAFFFPYGRVLSMQFLLGGGEATVMKSTLPSLCHKHGCEAPSGLVLRMEREQGAPGPGVGLFYSFVSTKNASAALGCNLLPAEQQESVPSLVAGRPLPCFPLYQSLGSFTYPCVLTSASPLLCSLLSSLVVRPGVECSGT